MTECCLKYQLYRKVLQTKVLQNYISYEKLSGRTSLSPPGVELGGSKDSNICRFLNLGIVKYVHFRAEC